MVKSTNAEIVQRIALVYEMTVKGASYSYIIRYCTEKWNVSTRQVETYISRVKEQLKELYDESYKKNLLEKTMAQLDDLYVKNYTIEDFRECRNLIESRNKMLGINSAEKIEATNTNINHNSEPLTKEEIKRISDELDNYL